MKRCPVALFLATAVLVSALGSDAIGAAPSAPPKSTPQEVFDAMRGSFRPDKAKALRVGYQFHLSGSNGGDWFVEVNDGQLKIDRGRIEHPNVTFIATDRDWVALSNGTLNGIWAFVTGRLKIRGDHALAKKLGEIFPSSSRIETRGNYAAAS